MLEWTVVWICESCSGAVSAQGQVNMESVLKRLMHVMLLKPVAGGDVCPQVAVRREIQAILSCDGCTCCATMRLTCASSSTKWPQVSCFWLTWNGTSSKW